MIYIKLIQCFAARKVWVVVWSQTTYWAVTFYISETEGNDG
jgi:hypothetical protein